MTTITDVCPDAEQIKVNLYNTMKRLGLMRKGLRINWAYGQIYLPGQYGKAEIRWIQ